MAKKNTKVINRSGTVNRSYLRTAIAAGELVLDIYISAPAPKIAKDVIHLAKEVAK